MNIDEKIKPCIKSTGTGSDDETPATLSGSAKIVEDDKICELCLHQDLYTDLVNDMCFLEIK